MGISDDETTILYVKPFRRSFDVNRAMTVEQICLKCATCSEFLFKPFYLFKLLFFRFRCLRRGCLIELVSSVNSPGNIF